MKTKRILSLVLALIMALALAVPAMAEDTANLKSLDKDGSDLKYSKSYEGKGWSTWNNVFFLGGANADSTDEEVSCWHLVTPNVKGGEAGIKAQVSNISITFDSEDTYVWDSSMALSTNDGGGNPGWMIVAPASWGRIVSGYAVGSDIGNFNISGYYKAGHGLEEEGTTSSTFTINKVVVGADSPAGFEFGIYNSDGEQVGDTMISDESGLASTEIKNLPAGQYTIVEINQSAAFEENTQVLVATVDANGEVTFAKDGDEELNTITNYALGAVDVKVDGIMQEYIEQTHELEYKLYSEGTLVSHIAPESKASLPDGITGKYLDNGMTYLSIDKAKLAAAGEDGVNIGIATSDPQRGNKTSWNTPAPAPQGEKDQPSYNLKIDENGKLVVTSDLPNIGVCLYSDKPVATKVGNGKKATTVMTVPSVNGPKDVKHLTGVTTASYDIPEGATFRFFLHIEDTEYYTNEVIGCKLVSSVTKAQAFDCTPVMTIKDADDEVVYTGEVKKVESLKRGTYTVTIEVDETNIWTETVTVQAGRTASVDFKTLTVAEMGEPVIKCPLKCGTLKMVPLVPAPVEP